jgi:pantetheine-phosphate adenylyltransferase
MKVMVGGTFDPLHDGHKRLLERSFKLAGQNGHVVIGLTTDTFAQKKTHPIHPYQERKRDLVSFIANQNYPAGWTIEPLNDRFGTAIEEEFDALVVSEETLQVAIEINRLRKELGKKKVDIHQITCVLAEDGRWISSTRIWRGEIDVHGRLVTKRDAGSG